MNHQKNSISWENKSSSASSFRCLVLRNLKKKTKKKTTNIKVLVCHTIVSVTKLHETLKVFSTWFVVVQRGFSINAGDCQFCCLFWHWCRLFCWLKIKNWKKKMFGYQWWLTCSNFLPSVENLHAFNQEFMIHWICGMYTLLEMFMFPILAFVHHLSCVYTSFCICFNAR